jgi:hypothetical protein
MAYKTHLRRNVIKNGRPGKPVCATNPYRENSMNNRRDAKNVPQDMIVSFAEFKTTPSEQRCSHCVDMGLVVRNRQRRDKGLAPVESLFACDEVTA